MDIYLKHTVQWLTVKALAFCLSGGGLFFADASLWGRETALSQVPCILLISILFFSLAVLGQLFYLPIMRKGGKGVLGYYLLYKVVRLLLAISLLVGYAFHNREFLLPFALNIVVLYLVEMVISILHSTRMERNSKIKQ